MTAEQLAAHLSGSAAIHLGATPERDIAVEACRIARVAIVRLSDEPRVVITADAIIENGVIRCLKDEVDAAVPDAERVIVFRNIGDAPLAPTLDAYLDVEMKAGRDVWFDPYVGASG